MILGLIHLIRGLEESEYNNLKNNMLNSIYSNGGFWIGQYEMGIEDEPRTASRSSEDFPSPVCKEGTYPYNYVKCSQAQKLASSVNSGNYISSLLFGIQWDLVMKYIEEKEEKTIEELTLDSTDWGNYANASFEITQGKYSEDDGDSFNNIKNGQPYTKEEGKFKDVLLTTGAKIKDERNSVLNIYDIAGNLNEWTLEYSGSPGIPATIRGGCYMGLGGLKAAACRRGEHGSTSIPSIGFRVAIY